MEPAESVACPNCGEPVEPEQDDDLVYYPCGCGHEFGYRRISQEEDATCAAGIPLAHLATLGGLTGAETDRLVYGGEPPRPESVVFLGIPVRRPEDN